MKDHLMKDRSMRRRILPPVLLLLPLLLPLMILAQTATATKAYSETIAASIKPLHSLVSMVLEGIDEPALLLPASPHTTQLKPSQMRLIGRADVIFILDPVMEVGLTKPLKDKANVIHLMEEADLKVLEIRVGSTDAEDHDDHGDAHHDDHGDAHHDDHDGHDDHGDAHNDGHDGHDHHAHDDPRDFHIWLDVGNAKAMIVAIRDALLPFYPNHTARLNANAAVALDRLDALDAEVAAILAGAADHNFIVFHDAYQYLEKRYGLRESISILGHHNEPVSASRLRWLQHVLEERPVACIFAEPQFDPKIANLLSEMSGASLAVIDPVGVRFDPGADHYPAMIKAIAKTMATCS